MYNRSSRWRELRKYDIWRNNRWTEKRYMSSYKNVHYDYQAEYINSNQHVSSWNWRSLNKNKIVKEKAKYTEREYFEMDHKHLLSNHGN